MVQIVKDGIYKLPINENLILQLYPLGEDSNQEGLFSDTTLITVNTSGEVMDFSDITIADYNPLAVQSMLYYDANRIRYAQENEQIEFLDRLSNSVENEDN